MRQLSLQNKYFLLQRDTFLVLPLLPDLFLPASPSISQTPWYGFQAVLLTHFFFGDAPMALLSLYFSLCGQLLAGPIYGKYLYAGDRAGLTFFWTSLLCSVQAYFADILYNYQLLEWLMETSAKPSPGLLFSWGKIVLATPCCQQSGP